MQEHDIECGRVVFSKAGRDSGRYYVVSEVVDANYVLILDGEKRKLAAPKKKKVKHLRATPDVLAGIGEKFKAGKQVFDSEIRSALRAYNTKDPV